MVTEHRCGNVRQQGPAAPAGWPCVVLWAEVKTELELAAAQAGEKATRIWQEEFSRSLSCRYPTCFSLPSLVLLRENKCSRGRFI